MAYIKKIVMQGFKSFAKRTEIPMDPLLSVIVGPNGSGKSNVTDAICFVLGRLSAKSMRATKTANLIYNGGKGNSPSEEAVVEMIFDNSTNIFSVNHPEVKISRVVRRNGQSIYKINDETKTRQEVLELLNQGGVDPDGFNIILQGEISRFIEMHHEERRQILEDVAGISVYEDRKQKSLNELGKTDERLKEVSITLNERQAYLRNLEEERQQALKHKKYGEDIKRDKASLIHKGLKEKNADKEKLDKNLLDYQGDLEKNRQDYDKVRREIAQLNLEIDEINKNIQAATGLQQEELHEGITVVRADLAGLSVRVENYRLQLSDKETRKGQLELDLKRLQNEVSELKQSVPKEDFDKLLKSKSTAFTSIEEKKAHLDKLKLDFNSVKINLDNSRKNYDKTVFDMSRTQEKINDMLRTAGKSKSEIENIDEIVDDIEKCAVQIKEFEKKRIFCLGDLSELKKEIFLLEKLKKDIVKLDICPICKRKVTEQHIKEINEKSDADIKVLNSKIEKADKERKELEKQIETLNEKLPKLREEEKNLHLSKASLKVVESMELEKEKLEKERKELFELIHSFEKKYRSLEVDINELKEIEDEYNQIKLDIKEIGGKQDSRTTIGLEVAKKTNEIDQIQGVLRKELKERPEIEQMIEELEGQIDEKQDVLREKEKQDSQLKKSFEGMFIKRNKLQDLSRDKELSAVNKQNKIREIEDEINAHKLTIAKFNAELETLTNEFKQYEGIQIVEASRHELEERIHKNEVNLQAMGSVNMRALEVYDSIKAEYDKVAEKVVILQREKEDIIKIIEEIDKKKKKAFMDVFNAVNKGFSDNVLKLSGKEANLELENEQDPFVGGVDILIKLSKGRYMDISGLSGGEKTLVALSLIFAIQEYRPYSFYIFDEIDAALDKRNSERLSTIIKNYMKNAQYIIITHNDSLITEATSLYGVSMQEGISKVISLKV